MPDSDTELVLARLLTDDSELFDVECSTRLGRMAEATSYSISTTCFPGLRLDELSCCKDDEVCDGDRVFNPLLLRSGELLEELLCDALLLCSVSCDVEEGDVA